MVEISASILTVEKGREAETFLTLEKSKIDYFHIDVMDGKFVMKDTYHEMVEYSSYLKRISNLPMSFSSCNSYSSPNGTQYFPYKSALSGPQIRTKR